MNGLHRIIVRRRKGRAGRSASFGLCLTNATLPEWQGLGQRPRDAQEGTLPSLTSALYVYILRAGVVTSVLMGSVPKVHGEAYCSTALSSRQGTGQSRRMNRIHRGSSQMRIMGCDVPANAPLCSASGRAAAACHAAVRGLQHSMQRLVHWRLRALAAAQIFNAPHAQYTAGICKAP